MGVIKRIPQQGRTGRTGRVVEANKCRRPDAGVVNEIVLSNFVTIDRFAGVFLAPGMGVLGNKRALEHSCPVVCRPVTAVKDFSHGVHSRHGQIIEIIPAPIGISRANISCRLFCFLARNAYWSCCSHSIYYCQNTRNNR